MMMCKECGFSTADADMRFCPNCGAPMSMVQQEVRVPAQNEGGFSTQPSNLGMPPAAEWDARELVGFHRTHGVLIEPVGKVGGDLSLVTSGLQFVSPKEYLKIPYGSISNAMMIKGMSVFKVDTINGQSYQFKVYGAMGFVKMILKIKNNPRLSYQGGISGTPQQIRAKGGALIGFGVCFIVFFFVSLYIFYSSSWLFIPCGVIFIILGSRTLNAAKMAETAPK